VSISPSDAVDPEEIGETGESVAADHADAEGAPQETSIGSSRSWREMLFSTSPEKPLGATESPWDPERGGPTRIYRAIQKMADFDGMPAIGDLVIGAVETVVAFEPDGGDDADEEIADDEQDDGGDVEEGATGLSPEQLSEENL
jgi:hypothetical protein